MWYQPLLVLKFCSVLAYAGGVAATFAAESEKARKAAAHRFASSALLGIWVFGYLLTLQLGIPLTELWIVGGFLFSFLAQGAVERVASTGLQRPVMGVLVGVLLACALVMMVYRPTWSAWFP